MMLRKVQVTRYITPLREGGSMPALVEADDAFQYVLKFKGAGQGVKALIAELIGGEIARQLGFRVPELVFASLDESFGRTEADEEIQDLLRFSEGLNLALHYLQGAQTFDLNVSNVDAQTASKIVWLDAFLTNVDRTVKNTNMLIWHHELWLIDHGASLLFHHTWDHWEKQSKNPFSLISSHVLLPLASELAQVDLQFRSLLKPEVFQQIVQNIPDDWLLDPWSEESPASKRDIYEKYLNSRIAHAAIFVKEAQDARAKII